MTARGTPSFVYFPDQPKGAGATACVYVGRHKRKGWTCAVKVYHSSNLSETKQRERELEIMKRLSHENIVKFIAIETEDPEFNAPPGIGGTKKYRPPVGDFFLTLSRGFTADQPQYQPQYRPQDQSQLHASPQEPHSGSTTVSTAGSASKNQNQTGKHVLIMELCSGGSLLKMLEKPENFYGFSEEEFLVFLKDISNAMQYLHLHHIVHRDIKPGNILCHILPDSSCVYKLTDFGACKELQNPDEQYTSLCGTEEYLHPEVFGAALIPSGLGPRRGGQFNSSMDLWSLGVTIYQVATGQLPFQSYGGRKNKEDMYQIITRKKPGVISGVQKVQGGEIVWSKDLPATCPLSSGLRRQLVPILDHLLESDARRRWDFTRYFSQAQSICSSLVVCYFCVSSQTEDRLYVSWDEVNSEAHLKDALAEVTELPETTQRYLHPTFSLSDVIRRPSTTPSPPQTSNSTLLKGGGAQGIVVSQHGMLTSPELPVYIIPRDVRSETGWMKIPNHELPKFPNISVSKGYDKDDVYIAREAAAYIVYVLRCVQQLHRYQQHYYNLVQLLSSLASLVSKLREMSETSPTFSSLHDFISEAKSCLPKCSCMNTVQSLRRNAELIADDFGEKKRKNTELSHNDEQIHRFDKKRLLDSITESFTIYRDQCHKNTMSVQNQFYQWLRVVLEEQARLVSEPALLQDLQNKISELLSQAPAILHDSIQWRGSSAENSDVRGLCGLEDERAAAAVESGSADLSKYEECKDSAFYSSPVQSSEPTDIPVEGPGVPGEGPGITGEGPGVPGEELGVSGESPGITGEEEMGPDEREILPELNSAGIVQKNKVKSIKKKNRSRNRLLQRLWYRFRCRLRTRKRGQLSGSNLYFKIRKHRRKVGRFYYTVHPVGGWVSAGCRGAEEVQDDGLDSGETVVGSDMEEMGPSTPSEKPHQDRVMLRGAEILDECLITKLHTLDNNTKLHTIDNTEKLRAIEQGDRMSVDESPYSVVTSASEAYGAFDEYSVNSSNQNLETNGRTFVKTCPMDIEDHDNLVCNSSAISVTEQVQLVSQLQPKKLSESKSEQVKVMSHLRPQRLPAGNTSKIKEEASRFATNMSSVALPHSNINLEDIPHLGVNRALPVRPQANVCAVSPIVNGVKHTGVTQGAEISTINHGAHNSTTSNNRNNNFPGRVDSPDFSNYSTANFDEPERTVYYDTNTKLKQVDQNFDDTQNRGQSVSNTLSTNNLITQETHLKSLAIPRGPTPNRSQTPELVYKPINKTHKQNDQFVLGRTGSNDRLNQHVVQPVAETIRTNRINPAVTTETRLNRTVPAISDINNRDTGASLNNVEDDYDSYVVGAEFNPNGR